MIYHVPKNSGLTENSSTCLTTRSARWFGCASVIDTLAGYTRAAILTETAGIVRRVVRTYKRFIITISSPYFPAAAGCAILCGFAVLEKILSGEEN